MEVKVRGNIKSHSVWMGSNFPFLLIGFLLTHTHKTRGKLWANSVLGTHVTASFLCQGDRGLRVVGGGRQGEGGESREGRQGFHRGGGVLQEIGTMLSSRSLSVCEHM